MFIEQPNTILKKLYPSALWRMDPEDKAIYLTFDDGPIPEVTPWVLDKLDQFLQLQAQEHGRCDGADTDGRFLLIQ